MGSTSTTEHHSIEEPAVQSQRARSLSRSKLPTEFASYDEALVSEVRKRFDEKTAKLEGSAGGRVKVEFHLHSNGQVSDVRATESDFKEPLAHSSMCERIIIESAPFGPWPDEMRQIVGDTYRRVEFNFIFREPNKTK